MKYGNEGKIRGSYKYFSTCAPVLQLDIDTKAQQSFDTNTEKTIGEGRQQQLLEYKQDIWVSGFGLIAN